MRVLQLISSSGYYGAENMLVNLAAALNQTGVNVVVAALQHSDNEPEILVRARERGLAPHAFPCRGRMDLRTAKLLRQFVAENHIHIIHTHGYKANLYCQFANTLVAQLATCHNWAVRSGSLGLYSVFDRLALRRVPAIAAVSSSVAARLADFGLRPPQVHVIANGIELSRFSRATPSLHRTGKRLIGTVTRLTAGKGLDVLLNAFSEIVASLPDVDLAIIGAGELDRDLHAQATALGLTDRVWFTGARNDMPEVYASLSAFVLPSLDEGMPMTLLEAMASQLPVVATTVGAIPELLGGMPDPRGWLVPPGDPTPLATALIAALGQTIDNGPRQLRAREFVETHYSSQAMARAYLDLYQSLRTAHRAA